jgi:hypothetical protein
MDFNYFSHIPLLSAAMSVTSGPVLELGAGYGSTLMLHGHCGSMKRNLFTIESNQDWLKQFLTFYRAWHILKKVDNFLDLPEYNQDWGLAFVDHGIALQRGPSIEKLKHVPVIIIHDTCHPFLYDYDRVINTFKYKLDYRNYGPQTTVVSNLKNVAQEFAGFCL